MRSATCVACVRDRKSSGMRTLHAVELCEKFLFEFETFSSLSLTFALFLFSPRASTPSLTILAALVALWSLKTLLSRCLAPVSLRSRLPNPPVFRTRLLRLSPRPPRPIRCCESMRSISSNSRLQLIGRSQTCRCRHWEERTRTSFRRNLTKSGWCRQRTDDHQAN